MKKYLSRNVICDGRHLGLALVTMADNGSCSASPFERETPDTVFTDSTITLTRQPSGQLTAKFTPELTR